MDMAELEGASGRDARATLTRARDLLVACGAVVYVSEVDRILAALRE
jgi:hypothetical protein